MRFQLTCLALLAMLALPASASDWYVDPAGGNDANSGGSPAAAWKTITHALATVTAPARVHLLPGTYSMSSGEGFPLALSEGLELVGDGGSAATIVDGSGPTTPSLFTIVVGIGVNSSGITNATRLAGLALRNGAEGVHIASSWNACNPLLEDLDISLCTTGVALASGSSIGVGTSSPHLVHVSAHACSVGMTFSSSANTYGGGGGLPALEDCSFSGNATAGVSLSSFRKSIGLIASRSRFQDDGSYGIYGSAGGGIGAGYVLQVELHDCLIARNAQEGVDLVAATSSTTVQAKVYGSTFTENGAEGLALHAAVSGSTVELDMANTILWNQADDLLAPPGSTVRDCDIGDGDFSGANGNFVADPLFRAPASGDWRLRWSSPCIDRANAADGSLLDLAGRARGIDGDLDTLHAGDLGCLEFAPLDAASIAQVGQPLLLEQWGESGASATLMLGRNGPQPPTPTPFGDFLLNPGAFRNLGATPAQPSPPFVRTIPIPNLPIYAGKTFTFQALTSSSIAPQGAAYTNAVTVVILP